MPDSSLNADAPHAGCARQRAAHKLVSLGHNVHGQILVAMHLVRRETSLANGVRIAQHRRFYLG